MLCVGEVNGRTAFQTRRLREAVSVAQLYLTGTDSKAIAATLVASDERARQIIKLGIQYMVQEGWLKSPESQEPVPSPGAKAPAPSQSTNEADGQDLS